MRARLVATVLSLCSASLLSAAAAEPSYIWWEAEKPTQTNFPPAKQGDAREQEVLSDGLWIGVDSNRTETKFLEYQINVPQAADYDMFVRKFWQHGPFRWRFDDQPWREVGKNCTLLDRVDIRTHWGANWVPMGSVKLSGGEHRLRVELLENTGVAFFDAFLLTTQPFNPRGKMKPDAPFPPAPEGWVNFDPGLDEFAQSPISLRNLNEKVAGENGFISVHGEDLVDGNGRPIKFWAVNAGPGVIDMPRNYVDKLAEFLAARGVNMIRLHGPLYHRSGPNAGQIDKPHLDNVFYFIAAMKKQGIYSHLSIHFQHWLSLNQAPQFPGYKADVHPFAIHFFNKEFQELFRMWWRELLTTPNPYTQHALNEEPAVAGVELLNEDSFFFWTFAHGRIPAEQMRILEKQFADWLINRYGSLEAAQQKWGTKPLKEDAPAEGRMGFLLLWNMFNNRDLRASDTARFLAEVQRKFFDDHYNFIRKDLGFKGAIAASNWTTASPRYFEPIDSWTNAGADFFDHHGYFSHPEKKKSTAFGIHPGDQYADRSAVRLDPSAPDKPRAMDLPFLDVIHNGKPSMVSEYAWTNPNRFRAESPLLTSSLASLSGMDSMVLFALSSVPAWPNTETNNIWPIQTPADAGQFPAAALIFRKGLVAEGKTMATVNANLEDLFQLKGAPHRSGELQDFVRAADIPADNSAPAKSDAAPVIDNRYLAIGKVYMNYTDKPSSAEMADLSPYVDTKAQTITSSNNQTRWEYGKGLFCVTAPQAQGVTGFLSANGAIELPDVQITSPQEFGAVVLVALDGKPIAQSEKILLQVMSEQKNSGWKTSAGEGGLKTIDNLGAAPVIYRAFSGHVKLKRPDAAKLKVTPLDWSGKEKSQLPPGETITIDPQYPYYLIQR